MSVKRKPLECGVFQDLEMAKHYYQETARWMQGVAKNFVSIAEKWGITDGKVLDVGTGPGSLAVGFAEVLPGVQVVGLDLSDAALELARKNAQESGASVRVSFEKGNAEDMPFEDDTFDLVISNNTLHLVEHPVSMFDEIQRVLKPQGRFIISDFRRYWLGLLTEHLRASYTPREVKDMLNQSKLQGWTVKDSLLWLSILSGGGDDGFR
jgi:ubiquinone/menaquinone biosynthesis C-methylase UbiE